MVGFLQRGGNMVLRVINPNETSGVFLKPLVREIVSKDAILHTDGFGAYRGLDKEYKAHQVVRHDLGEYVVGNSHTNTIEGFWAIMKRGIYGIYHQVSPKHLHRYCNEFGYRYNNRTLTGVERFEGAVKKVSDTRITYNVLIGK